MNSLPQIKSFSKKNFSTVVLNRYCPHCRKHGAHKHGVYRRAAPFSSFKRIFIPRFLCLSCRKTFSCLPFGLVRRIGISLTDLLRCATSADPWKKLEEKYSISRSTLWRWRRTGKKLLLNLPYIDEIVNDSWVKFSHLISQIQYPPPQLENYPTQLEYCVGMGVSV